MSRRSRTILAASSAAFALAVTGCGGGSGGEPITADGSEHRRAVRDEGRRGLQGRRGRRRHGRHIGTGGGFERFCAGETDLSNASRPIDEDEQASVRRRWRGLRRVPRRHRRAHERGQCRERLGHVLDRGAAQRDLEAGIDGGELEPGRFLVSGCSAEALWRGDGLRHVRLLHRRDQRRGRARAAPTSRRPKTTTSPCKGSRAIVAPSGTSASRTSRRTRTR